MRTGTPTYKAHRTRKSSTPPPECYQCGSLTNVDKGRCEACWSQASLSAQWDQKKAQFFSQLWPALFRAVQACRRLYLYYKPSSPGHWAQLAFHFEEDRIPDGWIIVTAERIPIHMTEPQLREWIGRMTQGLYIYPL